MRERIRTVRRWTFKVLALLLCFAAIVQLKYSTFDEPYNKYDNSVRKAEVLHLDHGDIYPALPVLGVMVMNGQNLLVEMLCSIDYPVETLVVFHNTDPEDEELSGSVRSKIEDIQLNTIDLGHSNIKRVVTLYRTNNLGFSAGVNKILLATPKAAFWLLVSNDITFHRGKLRELARNMADANSEQNHTCLWALVGDPVSPYAAFILTKKSLNMVGYFDENFWPAYAEDCDYTARLIRANCPIIFEINTTRFASHETSSSMKNAGGKSSYPSQVTRQGPSFNNFDYVIAKWGMNVCHLRSAQYPYMQRGGFDNPFNDPKKNLSAWSVDMDRRKALGGPGECIICNIS